MSVVSCDSPHDGTQYSSGAKADERAPRYVDASHDLSIGEEGRPDYEFSRVVGLGKLSSGQWFVFDHSSNQLRFYSARGDFLRKFGRSGEGPAEFRNVLFAESDADDNIYIYDQALRRLSVWTIDDGLRKSWRLRLSTQSSVPKAIGIPGRDMFVWSTFTTPECRNGSVASDTIAFYASSISRAGVSGSQIEQRESRELSAVPGLKRWGNTMNVPGICIPQVIPFAAAPLAVARDGKLFIALTDAFEVRIIDLDSRVSTAFSYPRRRSPLTESYVAAHINNVVEGSTTDESGQPIDMGMQLYQRRLQALPYPDSFPSVDRMLADEDGNVWVRLYPLPDAEESTWLIFSDQGTLLGEIGLPAALRVMEAASEHVAGVYVGALGTEQVQVYNLARPERR